MREILTASVEWTDKLHFWGKGGDYGQTVSVDYSPPLGDGRGYGGLDLLLMGLVACAGQTAMPIFGKMKQDVTRFVVSGTGKRTTEHPTVFTEIKIDFLIEGNGLSKELIEKAIRVSEEKYCPVWAMLKPSGAKISYTVEIKSS